MAQEAYDFARFEGTARAAQGAAQGAPARTPAQKQKTTLRSVKGGKGKAGATHKIFGSTMRLVWVFAFFALAFLRVQSEAQLTEYTQQIQTEIAALTVAKSEYSYLQTTLNASINLEQVEKVAKEQGLVKLDESQITYIRLTDEAQLTTNAQNWWQNWQETIALAWAQTFGILDP